MPHSPQYGELESLQKAIRSEGLDGWMFCNFRHRDKLSDEILHIPDSTNSRFWFYAVPALGEPVKIIHSVEPDALETLPGSKVFYISREDLVKAMQPLAGKSWAVHSSEELASISYLDAGTAAVLNKAGLRLVSAAALIQRVRSLLDAEGIATHERAAVHLYEIVKIAWEFVQYHFKNRTPLWEADIRHLMLEEMDKRQIITEHDLIIAAGRNSGNPHYNLTDRGAQIMEGDIIQFDLWAKEKQKSAVFADISWAGIYAEKITVRVQEHFAALVKAREGALSFIQEKLASGENPTGAAVDRVTREIINSLGFGAGLKHRTGHGIDTEIHGSGVNMDSVEFPDSRQILEGSCFSLEPGIYFSDCGMRTEIDVYIHEGSARISGLPHERQFTLLHCGY